MHLRRSEPPQPLRMQRLQCWALECNNWRSRGAELINNGQAMEVLTGLPVLLDRPEEPASPGDGGGPGDEGSAPGEDPSYGPPPPSPAGARSECFNIGTPPQGGSAEDDFYRAAPGGGSTSARPQSYYPGFFAEAKPPEEEAKAPPPAPPRKARPLTAKNVVPLAIVVPNGEALWFTLRKIDTSTSRLVVPAGFIRGALAGKPSSRTWPRTSSSSASRKD